MTSSLVQQKFGPAASDYAASTVHAKGPSLARMVELVAPQPDWRALDVATGAGHTAMAFAPRVAHVIASDITGEMLKEADKLASAKGFTNVETTLASADALPFADASFSLVTCRLAAHHFPDVAAFVSEVWRVLSSGGTFALVDNINPDANILPNASSSELRDSANVYNAFEKLRDPSHSHCLSLAEWLELLKDTGFMIANAEHMDQDIAFGPWTQRMRCDAAPAARLATMLGEQPLQGFLKPRSGDGGTVFTLQEAIIIARKPG